MSYIKMKMMITIKRLRQMKSKKAVPGIRNGDLHYVAILILFLIAGCQNDEAQKPVLNNNIETDIKQISVIDTGQTFRPIFNGEDLAGWDGDPRFWRVENGAIIGETSEENPTEENTFLIWREGKPDNFELTFEYRFVNVGESELFGNSGIQFRSERFTDKENTDLKWRVRGYQADFAVSDWIPGLHYDEQGRGIIARRGERVVLREDEDNSVDQFADEESLAQYITHDQWNPYRVYANGDTLRAFINGQLMHEVVDLTSEAEEKGILAFQIHQGPPMRVELRKVRLRELE